MTDEVPQRVQRRFNRAVAFVTVLDLLQELFNDSYSNYEKLVVPFEVEIAEALNEYPSLKPTTEGFNPATIVIEELSDEGALESKNGLQAALITIEAWYDQRDGAIELTRGDV